MGPRMSQGTATRRSHLVITPCRKTTQRDVFRKQGRNRSSTGTLRNSPSATRAGQRGRENVESTSERLLPPGEVAALFRVDPKTVTRWAAAGRISSIRTPGGHRRFRESEVRALLRGELPAAPAPRQSVEDEHPAHS